MQTGLTHLPRPPLPAASLRLGWTLALGLLLSACVPPQRPTSFVPREQVPLAGLATSQAGWPDPAWWHRYQDPQLDRLIEQAVAQSPSLDQARARYLTARLQIDSEKAKLGPTVAAAAAGSTTYGHMRASGLPPQESQLSQDNGSRSNGGLLGLIAYWDLDLWGKQKAAVAQAAGQARAAEAEQAVTANSLQYNVAASYFAWQVSQARLLVAQRNEQNSAHLQGLTRDRVKAGITDPQDLDTATAQLAQLRQATANVQGSAQLQLTQLAALLGTDPAQLGWLQPRPLPNIDTGLPADARLGLIARRPDIAAARWQIEASARQIDQARAAFYPDVSIAGLGAYLSADPSLGSGLRLHGPLAGLGPSITLPVFESGRLKAAYASSQAALDSAIADYNNTIVQAAQDVAQQVVNMQQQQAEMLQQQDQIAAIKRNQQRIDRQFEQGLTDQRQSLNNQLQLDQLADSRLQLDGQLINTQLGLTHALGGGYHSDSLPALPTSSNQDAHR